MARGLVGIIAVVMIAISVMPFIGPEVKFELLTYLAIPLVILAGSAGVAFVTERFEAIIGGMILAALWPVLFEMVKAV